MNRVDDRATALTRRRYQRLSVFYDVMEGLTERRYRPWREKLWAQVNGPRVLEVGVGTGKNMPYWPQGVQVTAIDLTPGMLDRARRRAQELERGADVRLGDVQALDFPDGSFDTAVATFVFCSVPDPVLGLRELKRVVRPGGRVLLLGRPAPRRVDGLGQPAGRAGDGREYTAPAVGAGVNRQTLDNVASAGLQVDSAEDLGASGVYKLIQASAGRAAYPPNGVLNATAKHVQSTWSNVN